MINLEGFVALEVLESSGLLLRHTVDCSQAPDEIAAMNSNDLPTREEPSQDIERNAVVRIVEGRN